MPPDTEYGAEVAGDRPDVRAAAAAHREVHVDPLALAAYVGDDELVHGDLAGRQLHVLAGPDPGVGPLPVDLDRRDRGRDLLEGADEGAGRGADVVLGEVLEIGRASCRARVL